MDGSAVVSFLGILLIIGVAGYIFVPYLLGSDSHRAKEKTSKNDIKSSLLSSLADLVYDYKSGKISEEDYKKLRMEIEAKLYAIEHPEVSKERKGLNNDDSSGKESNQKN